MQVFKAYFLVARYSRRTIFLSFGVFILAFILTIAGAARQANESFGFSRVPIVVINQDEGGTISQALETYLARENELVDLPFQKEGLHDALFHRRIGYVVIIPKGFSNSFLKGLNPKLQKAVIPNSPPSHHIDLQINGFLNTVNLQLAKGETDFLSKTFDNLDSQIKVTLRPFANDELNSFTEVYFRFLAYPLLALIISGISGTMLAFNRGDLDQRNLASPISRRERNLQLLAGHSVYALGCWLFFITLGLFLFKDVSAWYFLNSLVFTVVCVSLGFLLGDNTKSYDLQSGVIQIVSLS